MRSSATLVVIALALSVTGETRAAWPWQPIVYPTNYPTAYPVTAPISIASPWMPVNRPVPYRPLQTLPVYGTYQQGTFRTWNGNTVDHERWIGLDGLPHGQLKIRNPWGQTQQRINYRRPMY